MLSARFDLADPAFPVTLDDVPPPALPGPAWARVAVTAGGICGSDLHLFDPSYRGSGTVAPLVGFPMELGHEIGGVVVEAGRDCPVAEGTRVAVDPAILCEARGLEPCPACRAGGHAACQRLNEGQPAGFGHGFASGLGGGWSEQLVAHASQLHPAPDAVDDAGLALAEPLSIALHGVLRRLPEPGAPALVVGAGTIGLAAVAALRALAPTSEVTVVARHAHQAAAAQQLGAAHVVPADGEEIPRIGELVGGRVTGAGSDATIWGGHPYVVEAVGTGESLGVALRAAGQLGTVLLLGAIGRGETDLLLAWFKNLDLVGSFGYSVQEHQGDTAHTFDRALALLADGVWPSSLIVTHTMALVDLREAIATAQARDRGAIKVQLRPRG